MTFSFLRNLALSVILLSSTAQPGSAMIGRANQDFAAAGDEAVKLLSAYIKVDTTNPPGNEQKGAEFLAAVLKENGIESSIFNTAPGRACVYARLKGNGRKRPIILLNHIDVVPARAEDWKHPPFGGEIHDGELWGRGAGDMKGIAISQLEAMLMLKRSGQTLDRDVIFIGTPDEEMGGDFGAKWFVENKKDLVKDAEFLFNEGFHIERGEDGKAKYWGVDVGEKSALWLKLSTSGEAGHASMPLPDSSTNQLVRALQRVVDRPIEPLVLPAVREYFKKISTTESGPLKSTYADIDDSVKDPKLLREIFKDRLKYPMLINTVSLTVLKAGYKTNVIPAEATAELDCRLLPGVKRDDFIAQIKQLIGNSAVKVDVLDWQSTEASSFNTTCFEAIKAVAAKEAPGIPVVPVIVPWFTDSHWFRELGIACYGFEPFEIDAAHLATMHGKDERVPVAEISNGVRRFYKILELLTVER
jgi:acetylornithine deacetylase/succinyl-diaminopimelate desuccinylase-like protein